ncbi:MAG: bifunctional phosphopantothenoylcysteine decarboxylase/phosphopantothenate--cysteine ligase CoaBC, partial [Planctomycetaceae bacterium]|nr:bifunctional phosphopantothenoylcysteine decarboxylase/phosphopantothenate--cysteine ligase CoaBC [Planctomycetaceae bacterium]
EGPGRMLEPQAIIEALQALQSNSLLAGKKFLITAGPTREPLDPVRFITNRSSGKMGFALAETALEQGADVSLVCGPVQLQTDSRIRRIDIETALQMHEKVQELISSQDIFIACAAVADYRPAEEQPEKIKKSTEQTEIKLVRNPDIVEQARQTAPHVYTVGFAAETTELAQHAQQKLVNKGLDMIIANQVGKSAGDSGFDSDFNTVEVFWEGGQQSYSRELKKHLATLLIELIAQQYNNKKDYHSNVRYIETQTH